MGIDVFTVKQPQRKNLSDLSKAETFMDEENFSQRQGLGQSTCPMTSSSPQPESR